MVVMLEHWLAERKRPRQPHRTKLTARADPSANFEEKPSSSAHALSFDLDTKNIPVFANTVRVYGCQIPLQSFTQPNRKTENNFYIFIRPIRTVLDVPMKPFRLLCRGRMKATSTKDGGHKSDFLFVVS